MAGESDSHVPLSIEGLAAAIMKQLDFAEHSDEEEARNALKEIARLCRQALGPEGRTVEDVV